MNTPPRIEKARAKINLTLHVGPPADDGYHPLQSLVVFADIGDVLEMSSSEKDHSTLSIDGPFGDGLKADRSNLVLKTTKRITDQNFDFKLTKNLPIASGIGGGSADAGATARLICQASGTDIAQFNQALLALGADIPVCVKSETCLMEGKGERLSLLPDLGQVHAVLINPSIAVSTGKVFGLFDDTEPSENNLSVDPIDSGGLLQMALAGRNDLQDPAISLAPEITTVLQALMAQDACQLARMSGSGATCFGLFPSRETAQKSQQDISTKHPDWWCVQTVLGNEI